MTKTDATNLIELSDRVASAKEQVMMYQSQGNQFNVEKWLNLYQERRSAFVDAVLKLVGETK